MDLEIFPSGEASWRGRTYRCAIGRSGIVTKKQEGDGGTPIGRFGVSALLYRADRLAAPATRLPVAPVGPADGWCDAPGDPRYNEWVRLPYPARHETLWRDDGLYDLVGISTYNTDPVVDAAGSAIFIHVAGPGLAPTEGCIAFDINDLLRILKEFGPDDAVHVRDVARPAAGDR